MRHKLRLYSPHSAQLAMHDSNERFRVGVWGRQSGKTTWAINELIKRAWERPRTTYWFVGPTYNLAHIVFRRIMQGLSPAGISESNKTLLRVELKNGSSIQCVSGKEYDNLRGETLHGIVIDEVRDQHPDAWRLVFRHMLTTTRGWAAFISTPNGFDHFYDIHEQAKKSATGQWSTFKSPSTVNPLFTQTEYDELKAEMDEAAFDQEVNANFRDLTKGRVYSNYSEQNEMMTCPFSPGNQYAPFLPIVLATDFNLSPMSWILGQRKASDWWFFDEIFLQGSHTQEAAKELVNRLSHMSIKAMPQLIICGDASGKAGQRAAAGQSDYAILCQELDRAGIKWVNETPDSNPGVKDRINTVQSRLKDAEGKPHLFLSPHVPHLKKDFLRQVWKANATLDSGVDRMLGHCADAIGYPLCALDGLKLHGDVGTMRVIRRA